MSEASTIEMLNASCDKWVKRAVEAEMQRDELLRQNKELREALAPFAAILANGEPVGPIPRGLLDRSVTRQDLRKASATFVAVGGYAKCAMCDGNGCANCRGSGVVGAVSPLPTVEPTH